MPSFSSALRPPELSFAMQLAMLGGSCSAYPVNWLLAAKDVKERI